jgi:uncharacterized damage-inducible protein DinB
MVTRAFIQTMAKYNAEMNRRIYSAAATLSDEQRRTPRGAFWGSIHGTLNHLLWGDQMWMSRFDGWARPQIGIKESAAFFADFGELHSARIDADQRILDWAQRVTDTWISKDQTWFSGAAEREMTWPHSFLVAHMFNHQTHHRGQAHVMLTAEGLAVGDTDLFLVVDPPQP